MKSYNHIFEKLIERENINIAIHNSSLGKRTRKEVEEVLKEPNVHIDKTIVLLVSRTFTIPKHKLIEINDGIVAKKRIIIQPRYCYEQIIHHATVQVLKPIIMKGMYPYTCGSIPGRGAHYGKKYIEKFIRENPKDVKYCFKLDVHHFFQSISHSKLKELFRKKIHDPNMIWLLDLIVDGYVDHTSDSGEKYGIPIGYYTSQWFANWFLQGLDHYIKEDLGIKCYVRYMDDMVLFCSNKRELHKVKDQVADYLRSLDLDIKSNWQIFRFDYHDRKGARKGRFLDFMGFRFYRDRTILRKSIMLKTTRKAKRLSKKDRYSWYEASQMISYLGWFKSADMYGCYQRYIKDKVKVRDLKYKVSKHGKELSAHVC